MKKIALIIFCTQLVHAQSIEKLIELGKEALADRNPPKAVIHFRAAQKLEPENRMVLSNLALTYYYMQHYKQAAQIYRQCITKEPNNLNFRYNLATIENKLGHFDQSTPLFEKIYKEYQNDSIKINLAKNHLRSEQWRQFEPLFPVSLWWYDQNIAGKTVNLELDKAGNGLGDALQFLQYARILNQAGAQVSVQVHKPLAPFCSRLPYIHKVYTTDDTLPYADKTYSICIASLLYCLRHTSMTRALWQPYLCADDQLVDQWHTKLSSDKKYKIGLCWQSNMVRDYSGKSFPSPRAVPIEAFEELLNLDQCSFYSLHKKEHLYSEMPSRVFQFDDTFDTEHGAFMDTAAVMHNMNLVITVDTSLAHLAAGMGIPTFLILNCESDYRWMSDTSTCRWYPTLTIYRQKDFGDWRPVLEKIHTDILARVAS